MKMFSVKKHICFILAMILVLGLFAACTASVPSQSASGEPSAQKETDAPEAKETPVPETETPIIETEEPTEEPAKEEPTEEPEPTPVVILHAQWNDPEIDWDNYDSRENYLRAHQLLIDFYEAEPMDDNKPLDIPIYYEADINFSFDHGYCYDTLNHDLPEEEPYLTEFRTVAFRKLAGGKAYIVFGSDTGNRYYSFFGKNCARDENGKRYFVISDGFTIIINEVHSYDDFKNVKIGDTIDAVCAVDPVAELYKSWAEWCLTDEEYSTYYTEMIDGREANGAPFSSIHYLSDGILLIQYHRNENNEMVIKNIIYSEDYKLPDMLGREVDYRILDVDLP